MHLFWETSTVAVSIWQIISVFPHVVLCSLKERMRRSGGLPGCSREPDELHSHFSTLGEKVFPGLVKEEMGDFSIEQSSLLMYRLRHQWGGREQTPGLWTIAHKQKTVSREPSGTVNKFVSTEEATERLTLTPKLVWKQICLPTIQWTENGF